MIDVVVEETVFAVIVIDTPDTAGYLRIGRPVLLCFKELQVVIAKSVNGIIGIQNQIKCRVSTLAEGVLLFKVKMDFCHQEIEAILTATEARMLDLKPGDEVDCFIKASQISISGHD